MIGPLYDYPTSFIIIIGSLNVIELILAVTIIGLAAIALAAVAPIEVQSASATADVMTETVGGGEQEASNNTSTNTTTNNFNNSNAVLGSLFLTGEDRLTLRYRMQVIEQYCLQRVLQL